MRTVLVFLFSSIWLGCSDIGNQSTAITDEIELSSSSFCSSSSEISLASSATDNNFSSSSSNSSVQVSSNSTNPNQSSSTSIPTKPSLPITVSNSIWSRSLVENALTLTVPISSQGNCFQDSASIKKFRSMADSQKNVWEANKPEKYLFEYWHPYAGILREKPYQIEVINGIGYPLFYGFPSMGNLPKSIDEIYEFLGTQLDALLANLCENQNSIPPLFNINVAYELGTGIPTKISIDPDAYVDDDEISLNLQNFYYSSQSKNFTANTVTIESLQECQGANTPQTISISNEDLATLLTEDQNKTLQCPSENLCSVTEECSHSYLLIAEDATVMQKIQLLYNDRIYYHSKEYNDLFSTVLAENNLPEPF